MTKSFKKTGFVTGSVKKFSAPKRRSVAKSTRSKAKRELTQAEIDRRHTLNRLRAVERKLQRLEKQGIAISGSRFDPRRNVDLRSYNRKALANYARELDQFMDRKNQFKGDAFGRPIPIAKYREYKRAEKRANARIERELAGVADIKFPGQSMTVGERRAMLSDNKNLRLAGGHNYWSKWHREAANFFSEEKLDQAIKHMEDRASGKLSRRTVNDLREQFKKFTDSLDRPDIYELANQLNDKEFQFMFDHSGVLDILAEYYGTSALVMGNQDQAIIFTEIDETLDVAKGMFEYALKPGSFRGRL